MGSVSGGHLDVLFFAVLPYVALVLFLVVTVQRYRKQSFSYSSLSSQFLENRQHFWGMVPFHYGILFVLLVALAFRTGGLGADSLLWLPAVPIIGLLRTPKTANGTARPTTTKQLKGIARRAW